MTTEIEMVPLGQADLGLMRVGEEAWNSWRPETVAPITTPLNALARRQINFVLDPKASCTITERLMLHFNDHWDKYVAMWVVGGALYNGYRTFNDFSSTNEGWGRFGVKLLATGLGMFGGAIIGFTASFITSASIEMFGSSVYELERSIRRRFSNLW